MSIALNGDGIISGVSTLTNPSEITVGTGASVFSPTTNELALGTNGSERVRVSAAGSFGLGTVSPSEKLHVGGGSGENTTIKVESTATATERSAIEFFNGSVSRGRIGGSNDFDGITIDSSSTESAAAIRFRTGGGSLSEKLRVLAAGGLTFNGDTAAANALDDYEEGSWTPALATPGTVTYTNRKGRYVKVGKQVTCWFDIRVNTLGTGGTTGLAGLPFTAANYADANENLYAFAGQVGEYANLAANYYSFWLYVGRNQSFASFAGQTALDGSSAADVTAWASGCTIAGTFTYEAA